MGDNKFYKDDRAPFKDRARLLTGEERKVILDGYNNVGIKDMINFSIIFCVAAILLIALLGMKNGLIMVVFTGILVINYFIKLRSVVKKVKANKMYAIDAVYDDISGKYHRVYLKNYKKTYGGYNLLVREPLRRGDKVIVLQMWGQAWVYKARR